MSTTAARDGRSEPSRLAATWTRRWIPALDALRTFWRPALVVLGLGVLGLAIAAAPAALSPGGDHDAALSVAAEPAAIDAGLVWTSAARTPEATSNLAAASLLDLLETLGWVAFAVAGISILAVGVSQMVIRAGEASVRRAVGASRQVLLTSHLLEGALLAAGALPLGIVIARLVALRAASTSRVGGALALGLALGLFVFASVLWAAFDAVLGSFPIADGSVLLSVSGAVTVTSLFATLGPLRRLIWANPAEQLH